MKKILKKASSILVALVMLVFSIPISVSAATVDNAAFAAKIKQLQTVFRNGEYWNAYNACGYEGTGTISCPSCSNERRSFCYGTCPDSCGQFYYNGLWISGQCLGFACKMGNAIFGGNPYAWPQHTNGANIKPGDIIYGNLTSIMSGASTHAIFITSVSGNSVTYADCNYTGPCRVSWGRTTTISAIQTATAGGGAIIYHASNNGTTTGSSSSDPSINYASIQPSTYFIVSKSDGKALTLGNNEDYNTNNIHMYDTSWTNRGQHMVIYEAPDGYKIRPTDSSRLVNPYGDYAASGENINIYADVNDNSQWWKFQKVDGGYVIRNVQNPNLVIDNSQSDNAVLWEYNGGNNQIWELIPAVAPGKPVITNVKSSYEVSESVVVKWNSTSDTNQYNIAVEKKTNGEYKQLYWKENVSSGYNLNSVMNLDPGDYRVRVAAVNTKLPNGDYYLSTISDYVDFTVKAKTQTYTIAFNANGGTGSMANVTMTYGVAKNLPANTFTRTGYTFLGWSKDKNATTATYADKQSVKDLAASGTVTLYAVWKKNAVESNAALRIDDTTAYVGKTVQIPIYIDNAKLMGIAADVKFDPSVLKYQSYSDKAFDHIEVNADNISKGFLSFVCVNTSNITEGKIVVLTFEVIAQKACSTKIYVSSSDATDENNQITVKSSEATINIISSALGDVTGDGKVSTQDAIWVLQSIAKKRVLTDSQKNAADVTKDGKVSTQDAIWILQSIVGKRTL